MFSKIKTAGVAAAAAVMVGSAAVPADAAYMWCNQGGWGSRSAWAYCSGTGSWRLTATCYWAPKVSSGWVTQYGGTTSRNVSCPWFSYVTGVYVERAW